MSTNMTLDKRRPIFFVTKDGTKMLPQGAINAEVDNLYDVPPREVIRRVNVTSAYPFTWHLETLCYLYFEFRLRGYNREADALFIHLYRSCDMLLRPLVTHLPPHAREDALNMLAEVVFRNVVKGRSSGSIYEVCWFMAVRQDALDVRRGLVRQAVRDLKSVILPDEFEIVDDTFSRSLMVERAKEAIGSIENPKIRQAFILRRVFDKRIGDKDIPDTVSSIMGVDRSTVRSYLRQAHSCLSALQP